jgi:hypothetical protein
MLTNDRPTKSEPGGRENASSCYGSETAELTWPSQKPEKAEHRISKASREEAKNCSKEENEAGDIVIGRPKVVAFKLTGALGPNQRPDSTLLAFVSHRKSCYKRNLGFSTPRWL